MQGYSSLTFALHSSEPHFLDASQMATVQHFFDACICVPPFLRQASSCFLQYLCLPPVVLKDVVGLMRRHLDADGYGSGERNRSATGGFHFG